MSNSGFEPQSEDPLAAVPDWDDEYVDRVSDRLFHNYDLERNKTVQGHRFTLYGQLAIKRHKQFFHPALTYGDHETTEHLLVRRADSVSIADLEQLSELGDQLADAWIVPDEEHFGTEFVFGVIAPRVPEGVREFVSEFNSRTLLRYGYYGHYTVRLFVVAPERESSVASPDVDVVRAFRLWDESSEKKKEANGVFDRLRAVFRR